MSKITRRLSLLSLVLCASSALLIPQVSVAGTAGARLAGIMFGLNPISSASAASPVLGQSTDQVIANSIPSIFFASYSPVLGNPKGKVAVVVFLDYQCGYCRKQTQTLFSELEHNKNLRVVVKELPVLGEASVYATHAALAAKKQGRYAEMHEALMSSNMRLTEANVLAIARSLRLDVDQLQRDMQAPDIDAEIQRNEVLAEKLGFSVTPAMIVAPTPSYHRNGWHLPFHSMTVAMGYSSPSGLQRALQKAQAAPTM